MKRNMVYAVALASAVMALAVKSSYASVTTYGTLSNFDAVNDTGGDCEGFELELDGISSSDITYTFGAPYNRYGDPIIENITAAGGGPAVRVTYAATFTNGAWSISTPTATSPVMTGGHQFWTGGDPGYPGAVPGDHFGFGLNVNPTNTIYHWLVGDPQGNGFSYAGSSVKIPTPVITTAAPINPGAPAAVQVHVPAPNEIDPAENQFLPPAIWMKVFTTEQPDHPVALEDLVVGNPDVSETEVEWILLQDGVTDSADDLSDLNQGAESVTRRFEFFKYIGGYDPENGEALHDNPGSAPGLTDYVGEFIGGQNMAINFAALPVPEPASLGLLSAGIAALLLRRRR